MSTTPSPAYFEELAQALRGETEQLKHQRSSVTLFSGEFVGTFANHFYYRFEIPEEVFIRSIERVTFTFGKLKPISVTGNIITIDNQYLTVAFPQDFGKFLPEVHCSWKFEDQVQPVLDRLENFGAGSTVATALLQPADAGNKHGVGFEAEQIVQTPPEQFEAVKKIVQNKVSFVWGPISSGKSHVLALAALNYIKHGKRVLFVAPANDQVDETLLKIVAQGTQAGLPMAEWAARIDLPSLSSATGIAPYSFEAQIDRLKAEKRKIFQERVNLLAIYWKVKIKQILHEDFYAKVQELRDKQLEIKKQMEAGTREIASLQEAVSKVENASMLEKLKKGFSKEELAQAQKNLSDKQNVLKRLQNLGQALAGEITKVEVTNPVSGDELKEFNLTAKRMEELGGMEQIEKAIAEFSAVDPLPLLQAKRLVATSIDTAFVDEATRVQSFDMVIVDAAQTVSIPTLVALATMAKEKMIVCGDPFQLEPESAANTPVAQQWLQKDIFLHLAKTEQLTALFDWAKQNAQWSILLPTNFATTPKLSMFVASTLFDDKISVFAAPSARGKIYFIDTSEFGARVKQYAGRKKILPYNEVQSRRSVDCVKHAMLEPGRNSSDVGVILPFSGPTLHTKLQLRINGIRNVEVGTPQSFRDRRKKAIVFDTTMAGADYTMRQIDDKKIGEHRIVRTLNSIFSCVGEDIYIIADISHFKAMYKDRLFTRLLLLLQAEADQKQPNFANAVKRFDELDWKDRLSLISLSAQNAPALAAERTAETPAALKHDAELELTMKMMSKQQGQKPQQTQGRNFEREVFQSVSRVLAHRADVNLVAQYVGGDILFRSSFATEESISRLPNDSCQSEKEFRAVMERWNLLIYEMSGGTKADNALFTQKGPEARVRTDIRNLKAFYSSDVGAVIEEGKQKIAVEVGRIFQELLGKSQPGNPAEWSAAYLSFLGRVETYLAWLSDQLRR